MATDVAVAVFHAARETALGPILEQDVISVGAAADNTAALQPNNATALTVRVQTDTACWIAYGPSATASATNGLRLAANQTEYFQIQPGDRVSAIQL